MSGEFNEDEKCAKHEAKLAAKRAQENAREENEDESLRSEENIIQRREENELPFESILADQRRNYSSKEEYVYLIYNDLIKNFVKKWEGTYLRKPIVEEILDGSSRNEEDEKSDKSDEKTDESSNSEEKFDNKRWNLRTPDEQTEVIFINDNTYAGRISRRKMEGQGIYRWRDGCQYKGSFEDNKIQGKGLLEWQDSAWYEGDFQDGYRHGKGTMVDKNFNLFYVGQWQHGSKHGKGYCRFERDDSYDGDWVMDKREGAGCYVYPNGSRYIGYWKNDSRDGIGTMIWPNGDVYRGEWKSGEMHGYGEYTWNGFFNDRLSWPQEICYMGEWRRGTRNGRGQVTLNSIGGARYSGEWRNDKKHGIGTIVGNNGDLTEGDPLFENDILLPVITMENHEENHEENTENQRKNKRDNNNKNEERNNMTENKLRSIATARVTTISKPEHSISLSHYTDRLGIVKKIETSSASSLISLMPEKCRICDEKSCRCIEKLYVRDEKPPEMVDSKILKTPSKLEDEEYWTYNCIIIHMPLIRKIYEDYSKIFCDSSPNCRFSMSRLSLWQLWRDCEIHKKNMSLVEIDNYLAANKSTLMEYPSCPFSRIEIWQLLHAFLEVSWHFYTKNNEIDETECRGKLASGLEKFLVNDVYPNVGKSNGILCTPERDLIPLYPVYELYQSIGQYHSAKKLVAAIFQRDSCNVEAREEFSSTKANDSDRSMDGKNCIIVGEKLSYLLNSQNLLIDPKIRWASEEGNNLTSDSLKIFQELGIMEFVGIISTVCPSIKDWETDAVINMEYQLTFLEFFEIFVEAGKHLAMKRKMMEETDAKKAETEERTSITENEKNQETKRSNSRLSTGSKVAKTRKKITAKR